MLERFIPTRKYKEKAFGSYPVQVLLFMADEDPLAMFKEQESTSPPASAASKQSSPAGLTAGSSSSHASPSSQTMPQAPTALSSTTDFQLVEGRLTLSVAAPAIHLELPRLNPALSHFKVSKSFFLRTYEGL